MYSLEPSHEHARALQGRSGSVRPYACELAEVRREADEAEVNTDMGMGMEVDVDAEVDGGTRRR